MNRLFCDEPLVIRDSTADLGLEAITRQGEIDEVVSMYPFFVFDTSTAPSSTDTLPKSRDRLISKDMAMDVLSLERLNAETMKYTGMALVDGVMPVMDNAAAAQKMDPVTGKPLLVEPRVMVLGLDWEALARFGRRPQVLVRPGAGEVLVSRKLSRDLELSAGQQQRVAIARALVNDPLIVWADEPTGNLDSDTSAEVMGLLERLNQQRGQTLVIVTHEPVASERAHRVIKMNDGRILDEERPS